MDSARRAIPVSVVSIQERQQLAQLAMRFCGNPTDAEDALQNALLTATLKADQLQDRQKRWAWLCRIVIQHCRLQSRNRRTRLRRDSAGGREAYCQKIQLRPTPGDRLDKVELAQVMRRLLVELPEQQRTAVMLKHLEKMDYAEIARIMSITENTARSHVRSGREALRRLILSRHPEWKE